MYRARAFHQLIIPCKSTTRCHILTSSHSLKAIFHQTVVLSSIWNLLTPIRYNRAYRNWILLKTIPSRLSIILSLNHNFINSKSYNQINSKWSKLNISCRINIFSKTNSKCYQINNRIRMYSNNKTNRAWIFQSRRLQWNCLGISLL